MPPESSLVLDPALVVGLGNPGVEYARHRHNVGAMVLDELARRCGVTLNRHKARALVADVRLGIQPGGAPGPRAVLARPTTYMNESGGPVAALASFYSIVPAAVVAVHDDLELDFGAVRVKRGGGEGGHNGLRALSSAGTSNSTSPASSASIRRRRTSSAVIWSSRSSTEDWNCVP